MRTTHRPVVKSINRFIRHVFVPHGGNSYRPYLIRRYGLLLIIGAVIGGQVAINLSHYGSVLGERPRVEIGQLYESTNKTRSEFNQRLLALSPQLSTAADAKAKNMFDEQYWAHTSPSGVSPWYWFDQSGYVYAAAGENLAKNFYTSEATVTAWMESEAHRKNLLSSDYSEVGFAVREGELRGEQTTLIVALYASPKSGGEVAAREVVTPNSSPDASRLSLLGTLGQSFQSLSPTLLGSLMLAVIALCVAFLAHIFRHMLPRDLRTSWYRHHGAIKTGVLLVVVGVGLVLSGVFI